MHIWCHYFIIFYDYVLQYFVCKKNSYVAKTIFAGKNYFSWNDFYIYTAVRTVISTTRLANSVQNPIHHEYNRNWEKKILTIISCSDAAWREGPAVCTHEPWLTALVRFLQTRWALYTGRRLTNTDDTDIVHFSQLCTLSHNSKRATTF